MDSAPDEVYSNLAGQLFFYPLEALLWHVPSYQSDDIADLYWQMKHRNTQILGQAVDDGFYILKYIQLYILITFKLGQKSG